jgi:xanthine dehydrogenase YagS FAD-binding subunit
MAQINDMMGSFELFQPTELDGAMDLLRRHGEEAWVLSGGMDTFDWLKDRAKRPTVVVDLGGIEELKGIQADTGSIRIGAMTTLTEVANHSEIRSRFPIVGQAAEKVATPQIRNQGTLGGNLCQDTRCWYYRAGWPCYRAGGNTCYANAPGALNREHSILEANRCVAVTPSDVAPTLIALDAEMEVRGRRGTRRVRAEDFFIGPAIDITRMTVLQPSELLTAIHIPDTWAGRPMYFEKVADRKAWDFALVNVASALEVTNGTIRDARIVVGGVAARPLRMRDTERAISGHAPNDQTLEVAAQAAVQGARPLQFNEYKVALTKNLVKRAIREARS